MLDDEQLELIGVQQGILDEMLRTLIYYRKLEAIQEKCPPVVLIKGALLKQFVVQWCQIFGSKKEQVHWSKLSATQNEIEPYAQEKMLSAAGLSEDGLAEYHESMLMLRNKFFAHFDLDIMTAHIPKMEAGLEIAISYRDWLIALVDGANRNGQPLNRRFHVTSDLLASIEEEAECLVRGAAQPFAAGATALTGGGRSSNVRFLTE